MPFSLLCFKKCSLIDFHVYQMDFSLTTFVNKFSELSPLSIWWYMKHTHTHIRSGLVLENYILNKQTPENRFVVGYDDDDGYGDEVFCFFFWHIFQKLLKRKIDDKTGWCEKMIGTRFTITYFNQFPLRNRLWLLLSIV